MSIEILTPYGYGVVDKDGHPLPNVARQTFVPLQAQVDEWNESETDTMAPWKIVKLYYSDAEVK